MRQRSWKAEFRLGGISEAGMYDLIIPLYYTYSFDDLTTCFHSGTRGTYLLLNTTLYIFKSYSQRLPRYKILSNFALIINLLFLIDARSYISYRVCTNYSRDSRCL